MFCDLSSIVSEEPFDYIKACHRVAKKDEIDFNVSLLDCGMAVLIEDDLVPRHPKTLKP